MSERSNKDAPGGMEEVERAVTLPSNIEQEKAVIEDNEASHRPRVCFASSLSEF